MKLKCIVVDDELLSRRALSRLCDQHESLEMLADFENSHEALAFLEENEVDLLWLDIEMPELSGIEFLGQLTIMPLVVMTTNRTEYAFEAYQFNVIDYIKKPITLPRFKLAVEKVIEAYNRRASTAEVRQQDNDHQDIYIKTDGRYIRLPYDQISYIENTGDYVKVVTADKTHVVHTTMKYLEERLGGQFLRVHRSFIVHLHKIVDIEENNLVIANKVVPISRAHKAELMSRLNLL